MKKLEPSNTLSEKQRAESLHRELQRQILEYEKFSGGNAVRFSIVYYALRPATLVLAIATTLASSMTSPRSYVITIFAGLVTLVTALDSWLKPQVKWKLHDEANDTFSSMLRKLASIGNENLEALENLEHELDALIERYRNARLLE